MPLPRAIFTVTTGRSGTMLLANLFRSVPGVHAFHEPEPKFDPYLRDVQTRPGLAVEFMKRKLECMRGYGVYIETSHCFCEGFFLAAIEVGLEPDLILLSRNPREVSLSRLDRGGIPGRTPSGLQFLLSPRDSTALRPLTAEQFRQATDYQLCYWHTLEIAARQRAYAAFAVEMGHVAIHTTLDEISMLGGFSRLVNGLGLGAVNGDIYFRQNVSTNAWNYRKVHDIDFEFEEWQMEEWVANKH